MVAAFKLGLKDRNAFMINDCGGREEAHLKWREQQEQRLEVGESTGRACASVKTWFYVRIGFVVGGVQGEELE